MKRKVIGIDEEKCTGCGECIPDCPEGALQVIGGKARLVSDLFCDGLGACVGTCPEGALSVTEHEAGPYDESAVMARIAPQGEAVIRAHLEHLLAHDERGLHDQAVAYLQANHISVPEHGPAGCPPPSPGQRGRHPHPFAGCPGSAARSIPGGRHIDGQKTPGPQASELRQWPVQLALVSPDAPYFDDADLLVSADCAPFAYAGFHGELLRGRILVIFCPKLDSDLDAYVAKLAEIFSRHTVRSITVVHMEVPCCGGAGYVVERALERSGKKIPVKDVTVTIDGQLA